MSNRLDKQLVNLGFFPSREKAQIAILNKSVYVNDKLILKPSKEVEDADNIEVRDIFLKYVSKGGLKLEKAILDFNLDFQGKRVLDIGASTGGFTDAALKFGAEQVVAIDVGTDQLVEELRSHPKVESIENTDFRALTLEHLDWRKVDIIVTDVSFISLSLLIPYFKPFMKEDAIAVLLVKPQFEAGPTFLNKKGIVKDEKAYKIAIRKVVDAALSSGFHLQHIGLSTWFDLQKNLEFLTVFSMKSTSYKLDYNELFQQIKTQKNNLKNKIYHQ